MKKLVSILTLVFSLAVFSLAFAGGKADIPSWRYYWTANTNKLMYFYVCNRSEKAVDVTLSLRDEDGDPVTLNIVKVNDSFQSAANATATIPARGLRVFGLTEVSQATVIRGSGTISWEFNDQTEGDTCRPLAVVVKERELTNAAVGSCYRYGKYLGAYQLMVNGDTWF